MWAACWREFQFLKTSYWDLSLVSIVPLLVIIFLASMLSQGSPRQLPIVVVDQDHSSYSRQIIRNVQASASVSINSYQPSMLLAEQQLKQLNAWAVLHIPKQAQANLMHGKSPHIASYYNQAFFSIASTVSGGINSAVTDATQQQRQHLTRQLGLPPIEFTLPSIQVSALYNPQLSYELFLEPFAITAILHLLLACCVAASIGRELQVKLAGSDSGKRSHHNRNSNQSVNQNPNRQSSNSTYNALKYWQMLMGKQLPYIIIFSLWCFVWMVWMVTVRGWAIQGSVLLLFAGQIALFAAYALFASSIVLLTKDINTGLSVVAIYAGSSLSYAGVTLPTLGAPLFTRIWSNSLPYTAYSKLQTQQWIVGSPWQTSLVPMLTLLAFIGGFLLLSFLLVKRL